MSFCPYIILFYIQEAKFSYVPGNIISFLEIGLNLLLDLSFTSGFVTKVTTYWTMHFKMFQKHCICREYSVQFSHSVMSNSLQPHGIQHTRPPCLSPTAGVYSNWCPLSPWCHPTISSSVIPFSHLQSFPASGSSASASVLSMNNQDWFPLGWTGWISLQSTGLSRAFSNTTVQKHQYLSAQLSLYCNSHIHTGLLEKP